MLRTYLVLMVLLTGICVSFAQTGSGSDSLKTVTLYSSFDKDGNILPQFTDKGCVDLQNGSTSCLSTTSSMLYYGNQVGDYKDLLETTTLPSSQTGMVSLGKKNWNDEIRLKEVKLDPKPDQNKTNSVLANAAGNEGRGPSRSTNLPNGTSDVDTRNANVSVDLKEAIRENINSSPTSVVGNYIPNVPAKNRSGGINVRKGEMYLIRVADAGGNYHVLLHVDELQSGRSCTISWKRLSDSEVKVKSVAGK